MDARMLAVAALVRHATAHGLHTEREDVARVLGWVVGPDRGVAPVAGRGTFAVEWPVPGVREADHALAVAKVEAVTDHLWTPGPAAPALLGFAGA